MTHQIIDRKCCLGLGPGQNFGGMNKNQHKKYRGAGALVSLWWPKLYGKLQQPPKVSVCGRGLMRGEILITTNPKMNGS